MKQVPMALIQLLQTQQRMLIGHLFTFFMADGSQYYFTDLDLDITYNGNTYISNSLRIMGMKMKLAIGLQADEQDVTILATPSDTLGSATFLSGISEGLLDGAWIARDRLFWASSTGNAFQDYQRAPVGSARLFYGRVSNITKLGRTACELKVKSPLILLNLEMPRNYYGASCQWTLYSPGCTLNKASYATNYTITSFIAPKTINVASISTPTGADGIPYYQQGRLIFTSGVNNGLEMSLAGNGSTSISLQYPLRNSPSPGDTFTAYPGCSKQESTCTLKFNNVINFRGFPFVPQVMIAI